MPRPTYWVDQSTPFVGPLANSPGVDVLGVRKLLTANAIGDVLKRVVVCASAHAVVAATVPANIVPGWWAATYVDLGFHCDLGDPAINTAAFTPYLPQYKSELMSLELAPAVEPDPAHAGNYGVRYSVPEGVRTDIESVRTTLMGEGAFAPSVWLSWQLFQGDAPPLFNNLLSTTYASLVPHVAIRTLWEVHS